MILAALAAAASCTLPAGWGAVEARNTPYVVLGEMHGTDQGPATLTRIACALARRGERVLVAVEQDSDVDDALHAAWSLSETSDFALAVPGTLHWQGRRDGNSSRATLAMLVALHRLKVLGVSIGIVAFNGAKDDGQMARFKDLPGQGPHEAAQAENIGEATKAARYDRVLVLVGSLHARKRSVTLDGVEFDPMARRLAPAARVTSLLLTYSAGSSWSCHLKPGVVMDPVKGVAPDALDCGVHEMRGFAGANRAGVTLGTPVGLSAADGFDGVLHVGAATASPPVLP